MNKKTKLLTVGVLLLPFTLTGCIRGDRSGVQDKGWSSQNIGTPDGTVTCVLYDGYDGDTIACDWEGMKR